MLALDLVTLATTEPTHAFLFSSDEDLFPAVIGARGTTAKACSMTWVRPARPRGNSPNDDHLSTYSVRIIGEIP